MQLTYGQKEIAKSVALVVGANLLTRLITKSIVGNKNLQTEIQSHYSEMKKPKWSIPTWLFAPAWLTINFAQSLGTNQLLEQQDSPERRNALLAQLAAWTGFVAWMPGSLALRSPRASAAITYATTAAAFASVIFGARVQRRIGLAYLPMALWGLYASAQSTYSLRARS